MTMEARLHCHIHMYEYLSGVPARMSAIAKIIIEAGIPSVDREFLRIGETRVGSKGDWLCEKVWERIALGR